MKAFLMKNYQEIFRIALAIVLLYGVYRETGILTVLIFTALLLQSEFLVKWMKEQEKINTFVKDILATLILPKK